MKRRTTLVTDANVFPYAIKRGLITQHHTAVNCILNAGISKGMFFVNAKLYDRDNKIVVEYMAMGKDLIDALYNVTYPAFRKEYK